MNDAAQRLEAVLARVKGTSNEPYESLSVGSARRRLPVGAVALVVAVGLLVVGSVVYAVATNDDAAVLVRHIVQGYWIRP